MIVGKVVVGVECCESIFEVFFTSFPHSVALLSFYFILAVPDAKNSYTLISKILSFSWRELPFFPDLRV
jgi:hypothetical protein